MHVQHNIIILEINVTILLPRAHAQGGKVIGRVVIVVIVVVVVAIDSTKITISQDLGI